MEIKVSDNYKEKNFDTLSSIISFRRSGALSEGHTKYDLATEGYKSIIYSCIDAIANSVSGNEFIIRKNGEKIDFNKEEKDFLIKLLKRPNPLMTYFDFVYMLQVQMEIYNERYIYIVRNKLGIPVQLWVIPSYLINPVFKENSNNMDLIGYSLITTKNKIDFKPDEIVYDFIPSSVNIGRGDSPLSKILTEYDIHILSKRFAKNFYKNGAIPYGILTTDQKLTQAQVDMIKNQWRNAHRGVDKSWDIAVLFGGLKYEKISITPSSDEFIKQSKWTRDDILSIFKVPPLKLGYTENITSSSAKYQNEMYARDCILPKLKKLTTLFNDKLFPALKCNEYKIEFKSPLPEDEEIQVQKAKVCGTFGVATINEIRAFLGLEPLKDKIGDELVEPLNLPEGRTPKKDEVESKDMSKSYIEDIIKEVTQIDKALDSIDI